MCLIVLGWRVLPDFPLVVAANRDEFHRRPASPAAFWEDRPSILAGRDLQARGTWMGVARNGPHSIRFAAVTNYRGGTEPSAAQSRGSLVVDFLAGKDSPGEYVGKLLKAKGAYSGFNLISADGDELWWMSNRDDVPKRLAPGIYGLGNLLLDSPEVDGAKKAFAASVEAGPAVESLFATLAPARIVNPEYGTRCSTVLLRGADRRVRYAERSFSSNGAELDTVKHAF
jgi:uncharacterized protein with NRDE domain